MGTQAHVPFYEHNIKPLTPEPRGMTPREYLDLLCEGATADEWVSLATAFLNEMTEREPRSTSRD